MSNYDHDYYYEDVRRGSSFLMFPVGLIIGAALAPFYFSNPGMFTGFWASGQALFIEKLPDYAEYANYAMIGVVVVVAFLLRRLLRKFWLLTGVVLGAALWIPFGAHALHYAPQVGEFFPKLEAGLTTVVAKNDQFTLARNWAVDTVPIPADAVPSLSDAKAAEMAAPEPKTTQ